MDPILFKNLLSRDESELLDFKSEQYNFDSDDAKGAFLKDLLAFINTPRTGEAYMLLGVKKTPGIVGQICGISKHRDDNDFQTLAHGKITPPPKFAYEALTVDGRDCAVISIPVQRRPAYLAKRFGKLHENVVYIRRGSSTGTASPGEVIEMANAVANTKPLKFAVWAQPRLRKENVGYTLALHTWLKNTGEGSAENLLVDINSNMNFGLSSDHWTPQRASPPLRYVSTKPLHPDDEVHLASWRLAHIVTEEAKPPANVLRYGPITGQIVIRLRDSKPLKFSFEFTVEEIAELKFKQIDPS